MQKVDRAILEGVALLDLDERESVLEVRGSDAEEYLQRMLSCDLRKVTGTEVGGRGSTGTLMTGKGKLIAPFLIHRMPPEDSTHRFWLFAERSALDPLEEALDRLVILEEVTFHRPEVSVLSLQGPAADAALQGESAGGDPLPQLERERTRVDLGGEGAGWVVRHARSLAGGWDFVTPRAARDRLVTHWTDHGALLADAATIDRHRVLLGAPRFGVDATPANLPTEVGYDAAIAYDKGCYAGQEVVARIRTYGHVNRRLCQLQSPAGEVEVGASLSRTDDEEAKPIGKVTSATIDPRGDGTVCLAIVRYRHAAVGNEFVIEGGDRATITGVIGDDPSADPTG